MEWNYGASPPHDFQFPVKTVLSPDEEVILSKTDPESFRSFKSTQRFRPSSQSPPLESERTRYCIPKSPRTAEELISPPMTNSAKVLHRRQHLHRVGHALPSETGEPSDASTFRKNKSRGRGCRPSDKDLSSPGCSVDKEIGLCPEAPAPLNTKESEDSTIPEHYSQQYYRPPSLRDIEDPNEAPATEKSGLDSMMGGLSMTNGLQKSITSPGSSQLNCFPSAAVAQTQSRFPTAKDGRPLSTARAKPVSEAPNSRGGTRNVVGSSGRVQGGALGQRNGTNQLKSSSFSLWKAPSDYTTGLNICCGDDEVYSPDYSSSDRRETEAVIASTDNFGGETYIDTHCHLDFFFNKNSFRGRKTYRGIQSMASKEGNWSPACAGCITNFCEPSVFAKNGKNDWWERLLKSEPCVYVTFSCHPHFAWCYDDEIHDLIRERAQQYKDKVVAFGEMGLDYSHKNNTDHSLQKVAFARQIELALEFQKPIVIHCRDAENDCLSIAKDLIPKDYKIHRHCFTLGMDEARRWLDHFPNLYIGLTPLVCNKLSRERERLEEVIQELDLRRLVIETDAPFFVPHYFSSGDQYRRGSGHPGMGVAVAMKIAQVRNISVKEVLSQVRKNTLNLYGIDGSKV